MDDLYWCREGCGFVDKDHRCEQWCHIYRIPGEAIARIRAEARAEALKEAAEKIYELAHDFSPGEYYSRMKIITALHKLATIFADEPKEERGAEVGAGRPMQLPDCQRGIYCLESDDDKCRFPEDGCLRLMRRAEVERRIEEAGR